MYRGYYYDFETNLYYLNSRYYDPETGRFINADDISVLGSTKDVLNGLNLYAYCLNNPINSFDDNGDIPNWLKWLIFGIGAALVIAATIVLTTITAGAAATLIGTIAIGALIGGSVGYYNYQPTSITGFTKHGINNIISKNGHGVNEQILLDTVKKPAEVIPQAFRTKFKFVGKDGVVILNKLGKVITAWAKHRIGWRF